MGTFNLGNKIKLVNQNSNIDSDYGTYNSVAEANTAIIEGLRDLGKTVGIIEGGKVVEYWWKENTTDLGLVQKQADLTISNVTGLPEALALKADFEDLENGTNIDAGAWEDVLGLDDKADKTNVLEKDNTTPFTPDADYEPATKKYVDDKEIPVSATPVEGGTDAFSTGGAFNELALKADKTETASINQKIITSLDTVETTTSFYSNNFPFTSEGVLSLLTLKKDIKYTITASSSDVLTNGLKFYDGVTILETFPFGTDFVAGVSFDITPTSDFILGVRTQLSGVSVQFDVDYLKSTSEKITLIDSELLVLDGKTNENSLKIDETLNPVENIDILTDGTITTNTAGVTNTDVTLLENKRYKITFSSLETLNSGLRFYTNAGALEIANYPSSTDFTTPITFNYTALTDGLFGFRTFETGLDVDIKVELLEYVSPFSAVVTDVNALETLNENVEVLKFENFIPTATTRVLQREFSRYSGKTLTVNIKGQYTGQFTVYATVGGVVSTILNITATDFNVVGGIDYDLPIPLNCQSIDFRFYQNANIVDNVTIFSKELKSTSLPFPSNQWEDKSIAFYGNSITAINKGDVSKPFTDYTFWHTIIGKFLNLKKVFGRGFGSQRYIYGTDGGTICFVNTVDGTSNSRANGFSLDTYTGTIPAGTTAVRGAYSSWLRIKTSFPTSIKDTIDSVVIMGATNDPIDATPLAWVASDTTDPEWASSTEYATYGGDYNITTLEGGIASTIMKFQAWMPNARIIIATPLSGRGTTGSLNMANPLTEEYTKSITVRKIANIFSIPIIDINSETGINGANRTTFIDDGVHPYGLEGREALAMGFLGGLKKIFPRIIYTNTI